MGTTEKIIVKEKLAPKFFLALRIVIFLFIIAGTIYVILVFHPSKEKSVKKEMGYIQERITRDRK